jgi:hypothetical protein
MFLFVISVHVKRNYHSVILNNFMLNIESSDGHILFMHETSGGVEISLKSSAPLSHRAK